MSDWICTCISVLVAIYSLAFLALFSFALCTASYDCTTLNSLLSFRLSSIAVWTLCTSIPLAHTNTYVLMTELMSLITVKSCMILTIMSLSFESLLNSSFISCPLLYIYILLSLHRVLLSTFSFLLSYLLSLQYCNNRIVSLCWGLNVLVEILNKLSTALHASCVVCVRVCMKCRPCLTSQSLVIGTLAVLLVSYDWNYYFLLSEVS